MGTLELVSPEKIIQVLNNSDKSVIGKLTIPPVGEISFLLYLLLGE